MDVDTDGGDGVGAEREGRNGGDTPMVEEDKVPHAKQGEAEGRCDDHSTAPQEGERGESSSLSSELECLKGHIRGLRSGCVGFS